MIASSWYSCWQFLFCAVACCGRAVEGTIACCCPWCSRTWHDVVTIAVVQPLLAGTSVIGGRAALLKLLLQLVLLLYANVPVLWLGKQPCWFIDGQCCGLGCGP